MTIMVGQMFGIEPSRTNTFFEKVFPKYPARREPSPILGFFLLDAFAHGAIYLIRDANLTPGASGNSLRLASLAVAFQLAG
jgi:hypothetical protein